MSINIGYFQEFIGEIAALSAAFLWAAASIIYSRLGLKISPLQLNVYKGIIAIALLVITLIGQKATFDNIALYPLLMLSVSGAIGIGLGDTAYFAALNILGARRTLLLETLSPPIGALLALIFMSEQLSSSAWCGIILTLGGIVWVISERTPIATKKSIKMKAGIIYAILAAVAQAFGAVISRFALLQSDISPLTSALVRLLAGTAIVWLLWLVTNRRQTGLTRSLLIKSNLSITNWSAVAIAAFSGTYLGIWLQQTSLKYAPTGIAQTLLATSPLFVLPIVAFMGEKISWRSVLGVFISLGGVAFLFINVN
ncbi:DMT family transporter [Myxosarcina sp. GI1]|uniref:DMT family transporter n=1 Tax=Myxosarcina sp. GI1 TaxID=1541065 RepID=UPI0020A20955|nr:DMT family transporter [Myxosarcina sp. GI1]